MKPKKTRRASDLFISFCFLAFLFVGMAATLLRNSEEYSLDRKSTRLNSSHMA